MTEKEFDTQYQKLTNQLSIQRKEIENLKSTVETLQHPRLVSNGYILNKISLAFSSVSLLGCIIIMCVLSANL